jgi:tetratricopeptide (TPR) repeat protein
MESQRMDAFKAATKSGYDAMVRGELERAHRLFQEARDLAEECEAEDPDALDKADVNLAMIRVQVRHDELAERGLREVLLRSVNDDVIRMAAHCLAKILSHRSEHEKALRFAHLSLAKAEALGDPKRLHAALALVGNVHGNRSYLDEALRYFEQAFVILEEHEIDDPAQHAFYWTAYKDSIGYTLTLTGRAEEGRLHLEEALEKARTFGITDLVAETSADLCFACLQIGRLEEARMAGDAALEIAVASGHQQLQRNCYYLLGECASRAGDTAASRDYFQRLSRFYPQVPFLAEFLESYDISSMINLKEFA